MRLESLYCQHIQISLEPTIDAFLLLQRKVGLLYLFSTSVFNNFHVEG